MTKWDGYLTWICDKYAAILDTYVSTDVTERSGGLSGERSQPSEDLPEERPDTPYPGTPTDGEIASALEALQKYRRGHVLLVGKPGVGKTTTLHRFMVHQALKAQSDGHTEIPVLLEPRYHNSSRSMIGLVTSFLNRHGGNFSEKLVSDLLRAGSLVVLVDGLNELPSDDAQRDLGSFLKDYSDRAPLIFTSRFAKNAIVRTVETTLEMRGLTPWQVDQFVGKVLGTESEKMLTALRHGAWDLAASPLLLKMLCDTFRKMGKLPPNLGLAFRQFANDCANQMDEQLLGDQQFRRKWRDLVSFLAFAMIGRNSSPHSHLVIARDEAVSLLANYLEENKWGNPAESAEQFLENILRYCPVQLSEYDMVQFPHPLMQDYFAAEHLLKILPGETDNDTNSFLLNFLKWSEPICMATQIADDDALCLRLLELSWIIDWVLTARIAGSMPDQLQGRAVEWLLKHNIPEKLKIDLLGRSKSEAALVELGKALKDSKPEIREAATLALGKSGLPTASRLLVSALFDSYPAVLWGAAEALRKLDVSLAEADLLDALQTGDKHVRWGVVKALAGIRNARVIDALIKSLQDPDGNVRAKAAESLGILCDEAAIFGLEVLLRDKDYSVAASAAEALGKIGSPRAERALLEQLIYPHPMVRKKVAIALDQLVSKKALSDLVGYLKGPEPFLSRCAAEGLENMRGDDTIPPLIDALRNDDSAVRWTAARALGQKKARDALPDLAKLLKDPESSVVSSAAHALGLLGNAETASDLEEMLPSAPPDSELQYVILVALTRLGSSIGKDGLLKLATREGGSRQAYAAFDLADTGVLEAVEPLFTLLSHKEWLFRLRAADRLAKIPDHSFITRIRDLFHKTHDLLLIDAMSWIQQDLGFYNPDLLPWEREFCLLHLSDLHFGTKQDAQRWFSAMLLDVEMDLKPRRIDAIVMSGDIVYGPQERDGFEPAAAFLEDLMNRYSVEPASVVIVPGNHDVQLAPNPHENNETLKVDKFDRFRAFYSLIKGEEYPVSPEEQITVDVCPKERVVILGLNSAWEIDASNMQAANIRRDALDKGVRTIADKYKDNIWLKIAVWHHPLTSGGEDYIKDHGFLETLSKAGFRLGLHGHAHKDTHMRLHSVEVIGSGTFGVPPGKDLVPAVPWQYNFINIRDRNVEVIIRRKEDLHGEWQHHKTIDDIVI